MSARRKKGQTPMKYHGFYCTDELWKEMQECAVTVNESDSEYIRGSILERIKSNNVRCMVWNDEVIKASLDKALVEIRNHQQNETLCSQPFPVMPNKAEEMKKVLTEPVKQPKTTIQELKKTVKQMENKNDYFRPCPKGGK